MRTLPTDLAAHLALDATTLCRCWRVTRADSEVLGFTDHDRDLSFDSTTFLAETGLDAAEASAQLGLSIGGGEVAGALSSTGLAEAALARGLWDSAQVEVFLVNWQSPDQRLRLWVGEIGEVRRAGESFTAELRGLNHRLDAKIGRLFTASCDARLGDARCGVDLDDPDFTGTATVSSAEDRIAILTAGLDSFEDGWFTHGTLTWTSGANEGLTLDIREHRLTAQGVRLGFWQEAPDVIAASDAFTVKAGCDRRFPTCKAKFANVANFRGFPHMPGTDRALGYPSVSDGEHDGGSYFQ